MTGIVLATHAASGHVLPTTVVARELVRRGHDVVWYCGDAFKDEITRTGARFAPASPGALVHMDSLVDDFPAMARLHGPARAAWFIENVFVAPVVAQYRDLSAVFADSGADVLVADSTLLGAGLLHEMEDRLWATLSVAPLAIPDPDVAPFGPGWPPPTTAVQRARNKVMQRMADQTVLRGATQRMNQERATLGLDGVRTPFEANATPYLYMQATTPAFEYPRRNPPGHLHFVGPLLPQPRPDLELPDWWADVDGRRPVILVTQGTLTSVEDDLIAPAVRALAGAGALVLATTARGGPDLAGGAAPNVRTAPFLPLDRVLPRVDVVVTNGGYGTVHQALACGVPLVVAGQTEDKPEVCARVAWSGAGIDLKTSHPRPRQVAEAVASVLTEDGYRAAAARIAADFAGYDAPGTVADLVAKLVATRGAISSAA